MKRLCQAPVTEIERKLDAPSGGMLVRTHTIDGSNPEDAKPEIHDWSDSKENGIEIMKFRRAEGKRVSEMLGKTWLWSGLSTKDLESIVKASKERKYEPGDTIVKKGESGLGFYLVLDGSVEIKSDETTLSKLGEGQFFGEMSLLDDEPRSADVVAIEPSRCLILSEWSFKGLISSNPRIALKMLQELARRLRSTDRMLDPAVSG